MTQTSADPPQLFAAREPIFPRRVQGRFRTLKWWIMGVSFGIYYLTPTFADELRPEAPATVAALRATGLPVMLLSGDAERPTAALAARLGISDWIAGATPQAKAAHLAELRARGRRVLMVGDGLKDAAALAGADVSMSPGSAVDATRSAADLIVTGPLDRVASSLRLARTARRRILENFVFAFGYNVITVPIAFAGHVTPLIAAIAMSVSSLAVCLNGAPPWGAPVNILALLIPASLLLGLLALAGFLWLLRHDQLEDPDGHAAHPVGPLRRPPG